MHKNERGSSDVFYRSAWLGLIVGKWAAVRSQLSKESKPSWIIMRYRGFSTVKRTEIIDSFNDAPPDLTRTGWAERQTASVVHSFKSYFTSSGSTWRRQGLARGGHVATSQTQSLAPPRVCISDNNQLVCFHRLFETPTSPLWRVRPSLNLGGLYIDRSLFMETQLGPGESALSQLYFCWLF